MEKCLPHIGKFLFIIKVTEVIIMKIREVIQNVKIIMAELILQVNQLMKKQHETKFFMVM